jgi:hypothetical protein
MFGHYGHYNPHQNYPVYIASVIRWTLMDTTHWAYHGWLAPFNLNGCE